ncbi:methyltransferase domain-containing protein [Luminiphilus sp.]|nr:methyltransferase domain-containing protein [Luminiphilus sp.]
MNIKSYAEMILRPRGKRRFVRNLKNEPKILDVGCGNASVLGVKAMSPRCTYTGVDVADYAQTEFSKSLMDEYLVVDPQKFAETLEHLPRDFDAVLSSHNLEHCDEPDRVLGAMMSCLKPGGVIYLSFPCEQSIDFPSRHGTLNYYDDPTHTNQPPTVSQVLRALEGSGFEVTYCVNRYRPMPLFFLGLLFEPIARARKRIQLGTWELYGFESIIHGRKLRS